MKVYAVLGSTPAFMGQPIFDAGVAIGLVSFFDHPKAFASLDLLVKQIEIKRAARQEQALDNLPSRA